MKTVNIILMGFGNVGQAFLRVAHEKKEFCRVRYGLDIKSVSSCCPREKRILQGKVRAGYQILFHF